jgi:hypothetical protein
MITVSGKKEHAGKCARIVRNAFLKPMAAEIGDVAVDVRWRVSIVYFLELVVLEPKDVLDPRSVVKNRRFEFIYGHYHVWANGIEERGLEVRIGALRMDDTIDSGSLERFAQREAPIHIEEGFARMA